MVELFDKYRRNFFLFIMLCCPFLLYAQAKPTRDVSKDTQYNVTKKQSQNSPSPQKENLTKKVNSVNTNKTAAVKVNNTRSYRAKRKTKNKAATYLTVDIKNTTLSHSGGSAKVIINTDGKDWNVFGVPSWCEITKSRDNKSFVLSYQSNPEHNERKSSVSIIVDNKVAKLDFCQLGKPLNITYSINSAQLSHNETYGSKTKYLKLNVNITVKGAKGNICYVVATIKDNQGKYIKTAYGSQMVYPVKGDFVTTRQKIVPSTDDEEHFNIDMSLPNDVIALSEKQAYLTCDIDVRCDNTVESILGDITSLHFKATKKRKNIVTSCLTEKEFSTIPYCTNDSKDFSTPINNDNNTNKKSLNDNPKDTSKNTSGNSEIINDADYHVVVDKLPTFKGECTDMIVWLEQNSNLSKYELINSDNERIIVQIYVDKDGTVHHPSIINGGNKKAEEEILRVISLMPKWEPGEIGGEPVNCKVCLPIKISQ